jgi:hypothetical protein
MRYQGDRPPIAEFFAVLANIGDINTESLERIDALSEHLTQLLPPDHQAYLAAEGAGKGSTESPVDRRRNLLRAAHDITRYHLVPLLNGQAMRFHMPYFEGCYRLRGRKMVVEPIPEDKPDQWVRREFWGLLNEVPFPFSRCAVCARVSVPPRKGKPRRYCSESCKGKGVPSAAKRPAYIRAQRRKRKKAELLDAERIVRAWPPEEQRRMLERAFPKKSRRQLHYLLKEVQPQPPVSEQAGKGK